MTKQITLEEVLDLVYFEQGTSGRWYIHGIWSHVHGDVHGSIIGNVDGDVGGTINGKQWQSIETPREKLKRLIEEGADRDQLMEAFNQLENS